MRRRHADVTAHTAAPPAAVYALLADGSSYPKWSPIESFELERPGDSQPEGPGAVRRFQSGRTIGHDEILELVPNRSLKYASRSPLPVRDYIGEVTLADAPGGGTTINWHSSFFPKRAGTGPLVEWGIRRFIRKCTRGLAEYAAAHETTRDLSET